MTGPVTGSAAEPVTGPAAVPVTGPVTGPLAGPLTGPDLVLWLDAQDIDGDGDLGNDPAYGSAVARWADKSDYANHAIQTAPEVQPVYTQASASPARGAVGFTADGRQYLSVRNGPSLDLSHITAFVVARASGHTSNMWLFGKNSFSSEWTGYGIAVHHGQVTPWPHLGLGHAGVSTNGYLRYDEKSFHLYEINLDGSGLRRLTRGD